jgi:nicotinamide-nucleotide amidase
MCEKAASLFSADIALSITGIAGPTSYKNLPVGLVYIGLYFEGKTEVEECRYSPSESRRIIKLKAAYKALDILRRRLLTY